MSSYRYIEPTNLMTAGSMTGTSKISSSALNIKTIEKATFLAVWTGTPTGSFDVEASMDNVNFYSMNLQGLPTPSGSAGNLFIDITSTAAPYVRLSYTNSSGSGTLDITGSAKSI